ncbi:MAG: limonene-1,2-epoxide hydrolase [Pseudohongiellaceae bacterium]|jgi:limonene-1,2-epoxide hydrolase
MSTKTSIKTGLTKTSAEVLSGRVTEAYKSLGSGDFTLIEPLYADDIYFEDPSHGIQGKAGLMTYFVSMFKNTENCDFKFHQILTSHNDIFMTWTMLLNHRRLNGGNTIRVDGSSFLKTRNGKIYYHRDYFDMGAMVYENLPILGRLIKKIRLRLGQ